MKPTSSIADEDKKSQSLTQSLTNEQGRKLTLLQEENPKRVIARRQTLTTDLHPAGYMQKIKDSRSIRSS